MSVEFNVEALRTFNTDLSVYPNPSTGTFTIATNLIQGGLIEVFGSSGEKIVSKNVQMLSGTIMDLSVQGVFVVRIVTKEKIWTNKIVVK